MRDNTIFDDVFRTMMEKMTFLVVPLINDVFHTSYPADVEIVQLRNEYQRVDGEIITDSRLLIGNRIYHIECQSMILQLLLSLPESRDGGIGWSFHVLVCCI